MKEVNSLQQFFTFVGGLFVIWSLFTLFVWNQARRAKKLIQEVRKDNRGHRVFKLRERVPVVCESHIHHNVALGKMAIIGKTDNCEVCRKEAK